MWRRKKNSPKKAQKETLFIKILIVFMVLSETVLGAHHQVLTGAQKKQVIYAVEVQALHWAVNHAINEENREEGRYTFFFFYYIIFAY